MFGRTSKTFFSPNTNMFHLPLGLQNNGHRVLNVCYPDKKLGVSPSLVFKVSCVFSVSQISSNSTSHSNPCQLRCFGTYHYSDVILSLMSSKLIGVSIIYPTVCSGADQRKHQSSASLAFVRGIHWWPVNSPHKGPVTRNMSPFDDVIIFYGSPSGGLLTSLYIGINTIVIQVYQFIWNAL